eukprot:CAMPEP_0168339336 /NCGR_PEP_ID=MMETSP0213-20121227/13397_1 /TAXON_ID=151035 /ORGANISM="Euplotes harpa, Strain FSP1.4" /LENGTH=151 /DNA_ID=CAMNT_0008345341 /DNA_START=6 /DNA_END=461 /DNA_ORIENTATION=-
MKLYYFNLYGRAECIRILLHLAKADYEDVRYEFHEWPEHKADEERFEYAQLPVLEKDGKFYSQAGAILRFLAREHGFYPEDPEQAYFVENLTEAITDFNTGLFKLKDLKGDERTQAFESFVKSTVIPCFTTWQKRIEGNTTLSGTAGPWRT